MILLKSILDVLLFIVEANAVLAVLLLPIYLYTKDKKFSLKFFLGLAIPLSIAAIIYNILNNILIQN